jgi:hypothetical protein
MIQDIETDFFSKKIIGPVAAMILILALIGL